MDTPTAQKEVRFQSFNPYTTLYPGRRVVSRETLHLIKELRSQGYQVVVEPDDGTKLNYIAEKGLSELLANPIIAQVVAIPVGFAVNLFSSYVYDRLKRRPGNGEVHVVLEFDEQGRKARYDQTGAPISDERFQAILASLDERARRYSEAADIQPPDSTRPMPLHLEHSGKIVGWARLEIDDTGIFVKDGQVDAGTMERIQNGELKGFSIAGLIHSSECSICHQDYVDCNHIAGMEYEGHECTVSIRVDPAEVSIVKEPINPQALLRVAERSAEA